MNENEDDKDNNDKTTNNNNNNVTNNNNKNSNISNNNNNNALTKKEEPVKTFDEILQHVGDWGRYQMILLIFFFFFCLFNAYVVYTPILFLHVPDHWCTPDPSVYQNSSMSYEDILLESVPIDVETGERSQCMMFNRSREDSEGPISNSTWEQMSCQHGWTYNYTGYFTSMATEMNWVCEDSWKGPFTQSMFFIGGIFGTLVFGYTADHYGRYPTFMASGILLFITGIATPFCDTFVTFTVIRFLMGITYDITIQTFYLLALEYVAIDKRSLIGNLSYALGFTLGGCYESWLLKYLQEWKLFHHILFVQTALIFAAPWFLHESVRWLAAEGRIDESVKILKNIAKTNGKEVKEEVYQSFTKMVERQNKAALAENANQNWTGLFSTPRLRKHSILVIGTFMIIGGLFDGHVRNISNLSYSLYLTFTIAAALELPADLLVIWGIESFGRRWSTFISLALSGISMVICGIFQENDMVMAVFSMIGRFWITYAFNTGHQYVFEIFPTTLRAQGNAIASVFSLATQFFSPYIAHSSIISPSMPFLILGFGGILGAILSIFLPETAGVDLPNTVSEAEEFGRGQKIFSLPMLEKRRRKRVMKMVGYDNQGVIDEDTRVY